jgi:uncharacterized YigZ family protein
MNPNSPDEYLTIESQVRDKIKVESSIFIATAVPVNSEESVKNKLQSISREFHDATHNCFAWRIKDPQPERFKYSDAGEPRGTAGKPIFAAIESEQLHNVLVVVTRYFGGIKLGTGGLSRAYRLSAQNALQRAKKVTRWITSEIGISYPLKLTGKVNQILGKYEARVLESNYEDHARVSIQVRSGWLMHIKKALVEVTNGQVKFD